MAASYGQIDVVREMLVKVPGTIKSESPSLSDTEKPGTSDVSTIHLIIELVRTDRQTDRQTGFLWKALL